MRSTVRWRGAVAGAAFLAVAGLSAGRASLLVAAGVPLAYAAVGVLSTTADPGTLSARRTVEPSPAPPGRRVRVALTLTNEGDRPLPDVRLVDAVPEDLAVVDGSPRGADALAPGESLTLEYELAAKRGDYAFGSPSVRIRSLGAGSLTTTTLAATGDDRLACRLDAEAPPIEPRGDRYAGGFATDTPGQGLEFHSTRPYHPEDPADRIDWRHYAKRGDLATVDYRERHAAAVVLVVDAREAARVAAGPGRPTAAELAAYATVRALDDLLAAGHEVGVAVVGTDGSGPAGLHWVAPGSGRRHRARAVETVRDGVDAPTEGVDADRQRERLPWLVPPRAQVVLFSPLVDDWPVEAVRAWGARSLDRTVLSPDVLTHNTVTGQFGAVRRQVRLARCQAAGARTVDWQRTTPLSLVLDYAFAADARGALAAGGER